MGGGGGGGGGGLNLFIVGTSGGGCGGTSTNIKPAVLIGMAPLEWPFDLGGLGGGAPCEKVGICELIADELIGIVCSWLKNGTCFGGSGKFCNCSEN